MKSTRSLHWTPIALSIGLAFGSRAAIAQVIPAGGGPQMSAALNGVPLVNIVAPNGAGVSHNVYGQFNVGSSGLILNNATQAIDTKLGGAIAANPNLAGKPASLILNEVVQSNPSSLNGFVEVGGSAADVVIANPSGITCSGCGFINTPRVTLTTGTPNLETNGALEGFSVRGGTISISGAGLDASSQSYFDILARAVQISGQINAQDLQIVGGTENFVYATRAASAVAGGPGAPQFAIDSSVLGGMYANRIRLIATENGVGVRLLGDVAADSGALSITSAGDLVLEDHMSATGDVDITYSGTGNDAAAIAISDGATQSTIKAGGNLNLTAGSGGITLDGTELGATGNTVLTGVSLTDHGGSAAERFAGGALSVVTSDDIDLGGASPASWNGSAGLSMAARDLTIDPGVAVGASTSGSASGAVTLAATRNLSSSGNVEGVSATFTAQNQLTLGGQVEATRGVSIGAATSVTLAGTTQAGDAITIASPTITATGAALNAGGALTFQGSGGSPVATLAIGTGAKLIGDTIAGTIDELANSGTLQGVDGTTLTLGTLDNAAGAQLIGSTQALVSGSTLISAATFNNNGLIQSAGSLGLSSTSASPMSSSGTGRIIAAGDLTVTGAATSFENAGLLQSGGTLSLNNSQLALTNDASGVISGAQLAVTTASITNAGLMQAANSTHLTTGNFTNSGSGSSLISSTSGTAASTLTANDWDNYGAIYSLAPLTLNVGSGLRNESSGAIVGGSTLAITGSSAATSTLTNEGGGQIYGAFSLAVTNFNEIDNLLAWVTNPNQSNPNSAQIAQIGEILSSGTLTLATNTTTGSVTNQGIVNADGAISITTGTFSNQTVLPRAGTTLQYVLVPGSEQYGAPATAVQPSQLASEFSVLELLDLGPGGQPNGNTTSAANTLLSAYIFTSAHSGAVLDNEFFTVPLSGMDPQVLGLQYQYQPALLTDFNPNNIYRVWTGEVYQGYSFDATPVQAQITSNNSSVTLNLGRGGGTNASGILEGTAPTANGYGLTINAASGTAATTFTNTTLNVTPTTVSTAEGIEGWAPNYSTNAPYPVVEVANQTYWTLANPLVSTPDITGSVANSTPIALLGATIQSSATLQTGPGVSFSNLAGAVGYSYTDPASTRFPIPARPASPAAPVTVDGVTFILPTNPNGLYVLDLAPAATYLIEGNPRYTTLINPGLGSNYLITQLGLNPDTTEERLGDPSYEDFLVQQEVEQQTGLALIDGATSSTSQMQDLMTNAVWESKKENLTLGIALTSAQINALQEDIVWMVSTVVDGHTVLAPVVYLASAGRASTANSGAQLVATNIAITGANTFTNTGGTINASGNLTVDASGNISNTNGVISGGNVALTSSGGNITNTTTTTRYGDSANYNDIATRQASIDATGNLGLTATTGDITSTGAALGAGGNAALTAGGNVTLQNQTLSQQTTTTTSSGNWLTGEHSTTIVTDTQSSIGSTLTAGGNLSIDAGKSITLTGSQASTGGNATARAQNININDATTTDSQTVHTSSSGFTSGDMSVGYASSSSNSATTVTNVIGSSFSGAGNVTLKGAQSVNVAGSDVAAGGNLDVDTKHLTTTAAQDSVTQTSSSSGWGVGASLSGDTNSAGFGIMGTSSNASGNDASQSARVSTLTSGGNINLNSSGGTISQDGTQVFAGGNFNQTARTITYGAAQSTNSSSSTSSNLGIGLSVNANYNGGNFASQAEQFQDPNVGAPNVMANLGGTYSSSSSNQSGTTANVASIVARGNVNSTSTGATTLDGTQIQAGNQAHITAGTLDVTAATNTSNSSSSSMSAGGGIQGGVNVAGDPVGGAEGSYGTANGSGSSSSAVTASIRSNAGTQITTTSGDATFVGTNLSSGGATTIAAAGNVNFNQANDTASSSSSSQAYSGSVGTNANGTGSNAQASGSAQQSNGSGSSSTAVVGSIVSTGGISVSAGRNGDLTMQGTVLDTPGSIALTAGRNVNLDAATSTSQSSDSSWNASGSVSKGTSKSDAKAQNTGAGGNSGSASFGVSNGSGATTTQTGGVIDGRDITISSGGNTSMTGTQITAKGGATLNVGGDLSMQSAQTTTANSSSAFGAALGATSPKTNPNGSSNGDQGAAVNIGANDAHSTGNSVTNQNANLTGATVVVNTGGNATLDGAHIGAGNVSANIGGNLSVTSVADTASSSSVAGAAYAGYSGSSTNQGRKGFNGGALADGLSGSGASSSAASTTVASPSGIQGADSTTVNVLTGTTTLTGASIGSVGGTTALNTKSLTSGTVNQGASGSSMSVGGGLSASTQEVPGYSSSTQPTTSSTLVSTVGGQPIQGNVRVATVSAILQQPAIQQGLQLQQALAGAGVSTASASLSAATMTSMLQSAGVQVPPGASTQQLAGLINQTVQNGRSTLVQSLSNANVPNDQINGIMNAIHIGG